MTKDEFIHHRLRQHEAGPNNVINDEFGADQPRTSGNWAFNQLVVDDHTRSTRREIILTLREELL